MMNNGIQMLSKSAQDKFSIKSARTSWCHSQSSHISWCGNGNLILIRLAIVACIEFYNGFGHISEKPRRCSPYHRSRAHHNKINFKLETALTGCCRTLPYMPGKSILFDVLMDFKWTSRFASLCYSHFACYILFSNNGSSFHRLVEYNARWKLCDWPKG